MQFHFKYRDINVKCENHCSLFLSNHMKDLILCLLFFFVSNGQYTFNKVKIEKEKYIYRKPSSIKLTAMILV